MSVQQPAAKDTEKAEAASPPAAETEESLTEPTPKKRGRKRKHKETSDSEIINATEEDACITSTSVRRKSKVCSQPKVSYSHYFITFALSHVIFVVQRDGTSQEDTVTSSCEEPVNRSFATQTNKKTAAAPTITSKEIAKAVKEALDKVVFLSLDCR